MVAYVGSRITHFCKPYCYNIPGNDERTWRYGEGEGLAQRGPEDQGRAPW